MIAVVMDTRHCHIAESSTIRVQDAVQACVISRKVEYSIGLPVNMSVVTCGWVEVSKYICVVW